MLESTFLSASIRGQDKYCPYGRSSGTGETSNTTGPEIFCTAILLPSRVGRYGNCVNTFCISTILSLQPNGKASPKPSATNTHNTPCSCASTICPTDATLCHGNRYLPSNRVTEKYIRATLALSHGQLVFLIGDSLAVKDSSSKQTSHTHVAATCADVTISRSLRLHRPLPPKADLTLHP